MNQKTQIAERSLFFIRHAERCDKSYCTYEKARVANKEDPPITKIGISQAQLCGKRLTEQLCDVTNSIVIETSPYLRCIQTASIIAKELRVRQITVSYKWGEWLYYRSFPDGSPVSQLEINYMSEREFSQKWLDGMGFSYERDYEQIYSKRFPETQNQCKIRFEQNSRQLLQK